MNDIVDFVLRLNDQMSGGILKVASNTRTAFAGIDNVVAGTQRHLNGLGNTVKVDLNIESLGNAVREAEKLKRSMNDISEIGGRGGGRGGIAGGMFMGGLALQGTMMAGREMIDSVRSSLEKGMDAEQSIIGLATFVGKERAKGIYKDLQTQAVMTPFTTADMLPVEMGLVATGMTPERANKDMMNLMNAVSATGNAGNSFMFQLMGSHLAQAASAGKIDGLTLREFQRTAHIPVTRLVANDLFPEMAPAAGMKRVQNLESISYDTFTHALGRASAAGGMFAGALEAQSQTIKGKKSTILDYLGIGQAGAILNPQMHNNIIKLEDQIISGLKDFPKLMDDMQPVFNRMFTTVEDLLPSLRNFGGGIMDVVRPLGELAMSNGVTALLKDGFTIVGDGLHAIAPALTLFQKGLEGVIYVLKPFIHKMADMGHKHEWHPNKPIGYVWSDTTGFGAKGYGIDTAAMRHMKDSLQHNNFANPLHFFSNYAKADSFNRSGLGIEDQVQDVHKLISPMMKLEANNNSAKAAAKGGSSDNGLSETADAIVGGGSKVVTINYNAPLYKVEHQVFQSVKDAVADVARLKEELMKIFVGIPGMQ